jgi:hypothetical protein
VERAKAYDDHMAQVAQQAREQALAKEAEKWAKRRLEIREQEWKTAESLQKLVDQSIADALKYRVELKMGEVLQLLKESRIMRRLAAEMPTRPPSAETPTRPASAPPSGEKPKGAPRRKPEGTDGPERS